MKISQTKYSNLPFSKFPKKNILDNSVFSLRVGIMNTMSHEDNRRKKTSVQYVDAKKKYLFYFGKMNSARLKAMMIQVNKSTPRSKRI